VQGERPLFGVLNIDVVEDVIHLATGGLMAYVGIAAQNLAAVRGAVGGIGLFYLGVGATGFLVPTLFGLLPHGYSVIDNLIHVVLGALGLLVARADRRPRTTV
jgi:hypothetical protein